MIGIWLENGKCKDPNGIKLLCFFFLDFVRFKFENRGGIYRRGSSVFLTTVCVRDLLAILQANPCPKTSESEPNGGPGASVSNSNSSVSSCWQVVHCFSSSSLDCAIPFPFDNDLPPHGSFGRSNLTRVHHEVILLLIVRCMCLIRL